ncbi:MAG: S41 family peptidase [Candidatus Melainabacteria bacterium]|nr:S41 family peptidase [Candidatus Melainabacteria bacterium]
MNRRNSKRTSNRVRAYNRTLSMRAIALGIVLAPLLVVALLHVGRPKPAPLPERTGAALVPQFAINATPQELNRVWKDVALNVETRYLERDRIVTMLARMRKEYKDGTIHSKAQLDQALIDFVSTLGDRYAAVISAQQYTDLTVEMSGQVIGIELNFTQDNNSENWVVQGMPSGGPASKAGVQFGDVLVSVESYHIEELKKIGNPGELIQFLFAQNGVIGSKAKLTLRRGTDVFDFEVERTIIRTNPAISLPGTSGFDDPEMMHEGGMGFPSLRDDAQFVKVHFMESESFFKEFEATITKLSEDGIKGIALDLTDVHGGNADTAIQAAALFLESGVITYRINNVENDAIEMITFIAKDGKVVKETRGPFRKDAHGKPKIDPNLTAKVETLDWKSGLFKGSVVVGVNGGTQGSAELLAAALQKNLHAKLIATDVTFGKGRTLTYFQVSPDHVVRFSTAIHLQPDGSSIDKTGLQPDIGVPEGEFMGAMIGVLEQQMRVVPFPIGPKQKEELDLESLGKLFGEAKKLVEKMTK